jgi:hypothetical protein
MSMGSRLWKKSKQIDTTAWKRKRTCKKRVRPCLFLLLFLLFLFIVVPVEELPEDIHVYVEDPADRCVDDPNAPVATWEYYPNKTEQIVKEPVLLEQPDPSKCPSVMDTIPTTVEPHKPAFSTVCDNYDGILHISQGDAGGASGTIFFQFMVGMLQWADQFNYIPFVHLNNISKKVYDQKVHGRGESKSFTAMIGMDISHARDATDTKHCTFPGSPVLVSPLGQGEYRLDGTGVWEHYFLPVSPFDPNDPSCQAKPVVTMTHKHAVYGVHSQAPWAPHPWRYWMPDYIQKYDMPLQDWLMEQRQHAVRTTRRYIRFTPYMEQRAACAHPRPKNSLGMHIRHSDKESSRDIVPLTRFLEFALAFVKAVDGDIFVATDSALVLEEILQKWPTQVQARIIFQVGVQGLSWNETAAFDLGVSTHRTNTEALTDLLALSKCTYLLHGLSALSEAVFYLNPGLMKRAINLDDFEKDYQVDYFVHQILK